MHAGAGFDDLSHFEATQRLAHRIAVDAKLLCQLSVGGQAVTRRQTTAGDLSSNLIANDLKGAAGFDRLNQGVEGGGLSLHESRAEQEL